MTRAQYEEIYGVTPVFSATSTLDDEKPAPVRMTRAEYEETYYPKQVKQDGLGSKLVDRAKDAGDALWADKPSDLAPGRSMLRVGGAVTGAVADVVGAAISPVFSKLTEAISNIPSVQKFAMKKGTEKALDVTNEAVQITQDEWKKFEEKNPEIAQDIRDVTNIASFIPVGKGAQVAGKGVAKATETLTPQIVKQADQRGVNNVVKELAKIEDKYVKTRNANLYSKDVDASRTRIAKSNVLDGAVDTDGVIRTKGVGGAIDQYKAQTIDGLEDIVRKALIESKETIPVSEVRRVLVREVGSSGLEGADLVSALKKIDKEIEGLNTRIKGSSIVDLRYLHDNKIATTKNINYMTPPEKATYRKAVARAYKVLVEENSKKVEVKKINDELSTYYKDIERLELLDGARAEGGRLGKYTASMAGTLIGGAAGSVGGGVGAAVGGIIGGEAAQVLKGIGMSRTFKGGGKGLPKSAVLEKARLSIPDKAIKAKAGIPKTKEITKLEKDIAKNVADQKKAIAKGDFALVQALKEVYTVLVEELKKAIKAYKEMSPKEKSGGFVNFGADLPKKADTSGGFDLATQYKNTLEKQLKGTGLEGSTNAYDNAKFSRKTVEASTLKSQPDDASAVKNWEKRIASGERPEVLTRTQDGETVVADGAHKLQAYKNLGITEVPTIDALLPNGADTPIFSDALAKKWDAVNKAKKEMNKAKASPNPLYTEARGKSLEEFVKAQGTPFYRATVNEFDPSLLKTSGKGSGLYVTPKKETASSFLDDADAKAQGETRKMETLYISPEAKILKTGDLPPNLRWDYEGGTLTFNDLKKLGGPQGRSDKIVQWASKNGYDVVVFGEDGYRVIVNPKVVRTPKQLKEEWENANQN